MYGKLCLSGRWFCGWGSLMYLKTQFVVSKFALLEIESSELKFASKLICIFEKLPPCCGSYPVRLCIILVIQQFWVHGLLWRNEGVTDKRCLETVTKLVNNATKGSIRTSWWPREPVDCSRGYRYIRRMDAISHLGVCCKDSWYTAIPAS